MCLRMRRTDIVVSEFSPPVDDITSQGLTFGESPPWSFPPCLAALPPSLLSTSSLLLEKEEGEGGRKEGDRLQSSPLLLRLR